MTRQYLIIEKDGQDPTHHATPSKQFFNNKLGPHLIFFAIKIVLSTLLTSNWVQPLRQGKSGETGHVNGHFIVLSRR